MNRDGEELAVLITVFDPFEAEIIAAKLRSAGIEAVIKHDALCTVVGLTVDGCGRQDILVRTGELAEARGALSPEYGPPEYGRPEHGGPERGRDREGEDQSRAPHGEEA